MTGPIIIGDPGSAVLDLVQQLAGAGLRDGTVVWSDGLALREASESLIDAQWDALLVDPDDEPLSTAAMSHRAQIHGVPLAVIVCDAAPATTSVATMALRHLPEARVVLVGPDAAQAMLAFADLAEDLELSLHGATDLDSVVTMLRDMTDPALRQLKGS